MCVINRIFGYKYRQLRQYRQPQLSQQSPLGVEFRYDVVENALPSCDISGQRFYARFIGEPGKRIGTGNQREIGPRIK